MSDITIYYSPFCVVSRNALGLIRHAGIEPTVIDYLRTRPSETLLELLPVPRLPPFVKQDGSVVVDRGTRRW
jgi:arsenate reductase